MARVETHCTSRHASPRKTMLGSPFNKWNGLRHTESRGRTPHSGTSDAIGRVPTPSALSSFLSFLLLLFIIFRNRLLGVSFNTSTSRHDFIFSIIDRDNNKACLRYMFSFLTSKSVNSTEQDMEKCDAVVYIEYRINIRDCILLYHCSFLTRNM